MEFWIGMAYAAVEMVGTYKLKPMLQRMYNTYKSSPKWILKFASNSLGVQVDLQHIISPVSTDI